MSIILNGDTGISGVDGSNTTPSLVGNDTNTGVFFPAADTVALATGGIERLRVDSSGNLSMATNGAITSGKIISGTAVTLTTQTNVDFTGIPSWVKRITVMFNGVSTNGTSTIIIQLGTSGGFVTTGYLGGVAVAGAGLSDLLLTTGMAGILNDTSGQLHHGASIVSNLTSNTWVSQSANHRSNSGYGSFGGSSVTLSGTLTSVRITTVSGTPNFNAGSINIMYE